MYITLTHVTHTTCIHIVKYSVQQKLILVKGESLHKALPASGK